MNLNTDGHIRVILKLDAQMRCHGYDLLGRVHPEDVLDPLDGQSPMLCHVRLRHGLDGADANGAERVLGKTCHEIIDTRLAKLGEELGEEVERAFGVSWLSTLFEIVGALRQLTHIQRSLNQRGTEDVSRQKLASRSVSGSRRCSKRL